MKSLKTRVATGALAGAMALSLAVPAFAASANTTTVKATYAEVPIEVEVPTTGTITLNPLGMPVALSSTKTVAEKSTTSEQLANVPMYVQNNSSSDLLVGATVTTASKTITFGAESDKWDPEDSTAIPTTKKAVVYLQMVTAADQKTDANQDLKILTGTGTSAKVNADAIAVQVAGMKFDKDQELDPAKQAEEAAVLVLKATEDGKGDEAVAKTSDLKTQDSTPKQAYLAKLDKKASTGLANGNIGVFALLGEMAEDPQKEDGTADPWTKNDTFTSTIVFSFKVAKS